jgi:hypothetical protein
MKAICPWGTDRSTEAYNRCYEAVYALLCDIEQQAAAAEKQAEENRRLGVHLSHCNFGEYPNSCKYGEDNCPALSEGWSWLGKALQRAAAIRERQEEMRK